IGASPAFSDNGPSCDAIPLAKVKAAGGAGVTAPSTSTGSANGVATRSCNFGAISFTFQKEAYPTFVNVLNSSKTANSTTKTVPGLGQGAYSVVGTNNTFANGKMTTTKEIYVNVYKDGTLMTVTGSRAGYSAEEELAKAVLLLFK